MRTVIMAVAIIVCIAGCAGVHIQPISQEQAGNAHQSGSTANGYIVYEPVVVVEISTKEVCTGAKDDKGACKGSTEVQCSAGTPFVLPDYSKPYLISIASGFGKSGADITITDGWRLGNVKDNSDNTAILGAITNLLPLKSMMSLKATTEKCKAGLYRVTTDQKGAVLTPMLVY